MASISHFPSTSFCLSSRKSFALPLPYTRTNHCLLHPYRSHAIYASSTKKPRARRKARSNEDLCNDIREFVAAVGLPEGHVPSMKELSQHGREDLANIVRRRGYKFIKELLATSTMSNGKGTDTEECLTEKQGKSEESEPESIGEDEKVEDLAEDEISVSEVPSMPNVSNRANIESATNSSLQEKVVKFIQDGELDAVEDDSFDKLDEIGDDDGNGFVKSENVMEESSSPGEEHSERGLGRSDSVKMLNGGVATSKQVVIPMPGNSKQKDDYISSEGLFSADSDEESDVEARKRENLTEVNHLKFMLHQKELELSRLKEQIEKEKLALSVLQAKAETEISKAQKLILEKDAELHAAEENLSGLKEVQVQYQGDGESVEMAGSFNGWHHRIKMDPQPSSSSINPVGSSKSRLWTAVLWLYPGAYEIKFIVDGCWKIDPRRESVTVGTIQNNILRVDR